MHQGNHMEGNYSSPLLLIMIVRMILKNSGSSMNHWISLQGISSAQMLSYRKFFFQCFPPTNHLSYKITVLHAGAQEGNTRAGQFLNKSILHCNNHWQTKALPKCETFRFQATQTCFRCAVFVSFKIVWKFIYEVTCFHLKTVLTRSRASIQK